MQKQLTIDDIKFYCQSHLPIFYEDEKSYVINLRFPKDIKLWKLEKGTKLKTGDYETEVEKDYLFPVPYFQYPWIRLSKVKGVSGVYDFFHFSLGHLYIGESQNIKSRVKIHFPNIESSDPEFESVRNNTLLSKVIEKFDIKSINSFLEKCLLIYFPINGDKNDRRKFERKMIMEYKPIFNKGGW